MTSGGDARIAPLPNGTAMKLQGKKINFLGDSITEGCCASSPEFGYVEVMKRTYALAEARNYGIGGSRIALQQVQPIPGTPERSYCLRAPEMDPDADIVIVFGGTNDYGHGDAPLGTAADVTAHTFWGACNTLFAQLKARYPHALILILTPLHRSHEEDPCGEGYRGFPTAPLKDYVEILRKAAALHGLPLLDLYHVSKIQAHIPEIAASLTTDGLHPNNEGHEILAREIGNYLLTLS